MYDPLARKNSSFITNNQKQSFVSTYQSPAKPFNNLSGSSNTDEPNYIIENMVHVQSDPKVHKPPKASYVRRGDKPAIR